ncbi:MAG TPA: ATP-binding protein [Geomonas sp.]|nr:ATP-binding protein [Geomonas sp.]
MLYISKMLRKAIIAAGLFISLFLLWFAVFNYRKAAPIAEENLRGLALSVTAAIENMAVHDPSLASLAKFHTSDISYFALADRGGVYRFHSNPELIGTPVLDDDFLAKLNRESASEERVTLGTGERAFQYITPVYLPGRILMLRLILHTYRADEVVRRAKLSATILLGLLVAEWLLAAGLVRYARREELHQMEMARRENLARLGEMGALLAHEIRNPLAGIKGFAQVIAKRPAEERNRGFAGNIVTEAVRLENLVSNLLAYAGSDARPAECFDLDELIGHAISLLSAEALQSGVTVLYDSPGSLPVRGNRDRMEQVLLNLGKNALQAMPEGGQLSIGTQARGDRVVLTVRDGGQGLSGADLQRVFEPFFTTKSRGTGLGLALCKKIVEEHAGSIELTSVPGAGTTVTVTLPLARRERGHGGEP